VLVLCSTFSLSVYSALLYPLILPVCFALPHETCELRLFRLVQSELQAKCHLYQMRNANAVQYQVEERDQLISSRLSGRNIKTHRALQASSHYLSR
jgi:hypothetical protein